MNIIGIRSLFLGLLLTAQYAPPKVKDRSQQDEQVVFDIGSGAFNQNDASSNLIALVKSHAEDIRNIIAKLTNPNYLLIDDAKRQIDNFIAFLNHKNGIIIKIIEMNPLRKVISKLSNRDECNSKNITRINHLITSIIWIGYSLKRRFSTCSETVRKLNTHSYLQSYLFNNNTCDECTVERDKLKESIEKYSETVTELKRKSDGIICGKKNDVLIGLLMMTINSLDFYDFEMKQPKIVHFFDLMDTFDIATQIYFYPAQERFPELKDAIALCIDSWNVMQDRYLSLQHIHNTGVMNINMTVRYYTFSEEWLKQLNSSKHLLGLTKDTLEYEDMLSLEKGLRLNPCIQALDEATLLVSLAPLIFKYWAACNLIVKLPHVAYKIPFDSYDQNQVATCLTIFNSYKDKEIPECLRVTLKSHDVITILKQPFESLLELIKDGKLRKDSKYPIESLSNSIFLSIHAMKLLIKHNDQNPEGRKDFNQFNENATQVFEKLQSML
jgi:hypothetical protein